MKNDRTGEIAYFIESNRFIREGKLLSRRGGVYLFQFIEGGGIHIAENRLFPTEEAAQAEIDRRRGKHRRVPNGFQPVA